jgi:magnesium chelatase family protein
MCRCSDPQVQRYAGRISGPLRDRIDLVVEVAAGATGACERPGGSEERSATIQQRVVIARARQHARFADASMLNRQLEGKRLGEHCRLDRPSAALLDGAVRKFCLSARGYDRVLRVSRTIADLAGADGITGEHVGEALQYRFVEPD